jgi:septum formation protein
LIFGKRDRKPKLILASSSPRRAEILRRAGLPFDVRAANINESRHPHEAARSYVARLAAAKAHEAAEHAERKGLRATVIGADTAVVALGKILGKPVDVRDAKRMLRLLSGRTHTVLTGVCLIAVPGRAEAHHVESTRVTFAHLTDHEIDRYLLTGESFHKAGGYAIQGIAGRYVTHIEGCYFNVMGLPLARLWTLLRELGWEA